MTGSASAGASSLAVLSQNGRQGRGTRMRYLHTMLRVSNLEESLAFYCGQLGLVERRRWQNEAGRFTLVFLSSPEDPQARAALELTWNWDQEDLGTARNFGHLAYEVENIYALCERLQEGGVTILRPPRDGRMAFVRSPDLASIELLQAGEALAPMEPWVSMPSQGQW